MFLFLDFKGTFRSWLRNPGSTLAACSALALGIGSTITIFSLLSSLLLTPLPVTEADRVVRVSGFDRAGQTTQLSMPLALDLKRRLPALQGLALYRQTIRNVTGRSRPEMVHVLEADADLFRVMGVKLADGRPFDPHANAPGQPCQVVLSWSFWRNQYDGFPAVNQSLLLNGQPCAVTGILPQHLDLPESSEIWAPAVFDLHKFENGRRIQAWYLLARMNKGVTLASLNQALAAAAANFNRQNSEDAGVHLRADNLRDWLARGVKPSLYILFAAVAGVLLMACANVANLLLVRACGRVSEICVRVAMGATPRMIFRQMLMESMLLAVLASSIGLGLSVLAVRIIRNLPDTNIPRPESVSVDGRVCLFALGLALLTGFLFGAIPALRLAFVSVHGAWKQSGFRLTETRGQRATRRVLVAAETAIATVLLTCSLLLVRSFAAVSRIDPGFQTDHLLTAYLSLPPHRYGIDTAAFARFAEQVTRRLEGHSGIEAAAIATNVPMQNSHGGAPVQIEGQPVPRHEHDAPFVVDTDVSPGFRRTMRIPLLAGRDLNDHDNREDATSVLVNAAFVNRFFPSAPPVGRRLRYNPTVATDAPWQEIAGVIGDTRQDSREDVVHPEIYIPLARATGMFPAVIIRTLDDPATHLRQIEDAVHAVDADIPVFSPRTMEQVDARRLGARTFNTVLLTGFACAALLLAALGVFAVIAYSVSQRTAEFGLRLACGASDRHIHGLIIRQGIVPALAGIGLGVGAAYFLNHRLASLLFGVGPNDLLSVAGAVMLLALAAVAACLLPAWRATRISPYRALRYE